jgi:hypothetical protein
VRQAVGELLCSQECTRDMFVFVCAMPVSLAANSMKMTHLVVQARVGFQSSQREWTVSCNRNDCVHKALPPELQHVRMSCSRLPPPIHSVPNSAQMPRANWTERLTAPFRFGAQELLPSAVKLGSAVTVTAVMRRAASQLGRQLLGHHMRYQVRAA